MRWLGGSAEGGSPRFVPPKMLSSALGADTVSQRGNVLEGPCRWYGALDNRGGAFLDSEVLLSCRRFAVLDKNLIVCKIEMLVNQMESEAIELAMPD